MANITGRDIHACFMQAESGRWPWEQLTATMQATYEAVAAKLNAEWLAPLQSLVMDWLGLLQAYDALEELDPVADFASYEAWDESRAKLDARTNELLGKEAK